MKDPFALVHPDLRNHAKVMAGMFTAMPPLSPATLAQWRGNEFREFNDLSPEVTVRHIAIPGHSGAPDIPAYVINEQPQGQHPAILHMHGGGFVIGSARPLLPMLQQLAAFLDAVIISVDYRLAPEATWRQSCEDNYTALLWLRDNAGSLGVDLRRVGAMGGSAGGGHAALLAINARDREEVSIAFQALVYPMLDDRTGSAFPVPDHLGRLVWTETDNRFGWSAFLGQEAGNANVPPGAVPARTPDLAGLPPTFIGVGALDLFVEENIDFARRLLLAGVPVELHVVPGAFHGFDGAADVPVSTRFRDSLWAALRDGLSSKPEKPNAGI